MFFNATKHPAMDVPWTSPEGADVVIVIAKATFELDERGVVQPASKPSTIRLGDEPYDLEATNGSIRYPSDICYAKRGTDVVVVGSAVSPTPVKSVDVAIAVRDRTCTLRVHGERYFRRGAVGLTISEAMPFVSMPVVYERAYGGISQDISEVELANPAGVGVATSDDELVDTRAPQIEHPLKPHHSASDKHPPIGCGAIMSHWAPRRDHFGTCDANWVETRMPLFPTDFDIRYYNVAHPSLQQEIPLQPGDSVAVRGMSPEPFICTLPDWRLVMRARYDEGRTEIHPQIDTVIVEPARGRFELVVHGAFPTGRGKNVLRELQLDTP